MTVTKSKNTNLINAVTILKYINLKEFKLETKQNNKPQKVCFIVYKLLKTNLLKQ